jgi:hypothetical protein
MKLPNIFKNPIENVDDLKVRITIIIISAALVILGLLVFGVLGGFRKGIWLMLFRIAIFVGFLLVVFLFTPVLAGIMRNSGLVESFLGDVDLSTIPLIGGLADTILDTVYNVIAAIILLVVGSILNLIKLILTYRLNLKLKLLRSKVQRQKKKTRINNNGILSNLYVNGHWCFYRF